MSLTIFSRFSPLQWVDFTLYTHNMGSRGLKRVLVKNTYVVYSHRIQQRYCRERNDQQHHGIWISAKGTVSMLNTYLISRMQLMETRKDTASCSGRDEIFSSYFFQRTQEQYFRETAKMAPRVLYWPGHMRFALPSSYVDHCLDSSSHQIKQLNIHYCSGNLCNHIIYRLIQRQSLSLSKLLHQLLAH